MEDHYVYYENVSKNCNGSFRKLHDKSKVAPLYSVPEVGERCAVKILDKYFGRLPQDALLEDPLLPAPFENAL